MAGAGVPRVAAIHSLAGFGRCSLTVIIPVLSSMGIQVCPVPTAILSTHSGGFGDMSFTDFTGGMEAFAAHWRSLGLEFDAIYSGFLGSAAQIETVARFIDDFGGRPGQLIVVDPVMADGGRLYRTYTPEMQALMGSLVAKASIVTPNLTEARFLLGEPYEEHALAPDEIRSLVERLAALGPDAVILKTVPVTGGGYVNIAYRSSTGELHMVPFVRHPTDFPGTGDTFAAVVLGSLLRGDDLAGAVCRATRFLSAAVEATISAGTPAREGVLVEQVLPVLLERSSNRNVEGPRPQACTTQDSKEGSQ